MLRDMLRDMDAHGHPDGPVTPAGHRGRIVLAVALVPLALLTLAGLIGLWPAHEGFQIPAALQIGQTGAPVRTEPADVTSVRGGSCGGTGAAAAQYGCTLAGIRLTSGPDRGQHAVLQIAPGAGSPRLHAGDQILVEAAPSYVGGGPTYYFADFDRGHSLVWLAVLAAIVIVCIARWRGLAALFGVAFTILLLVRFLLPDLLDGRSPVECGLVCAATILFVVLYLAHGPSARTSTALLATLLSLALVALLSVTSVGLTHLTGLQSEENTAIQAYASQISLPGLIICGFVIGSLGVLNDVTVTQASAVWELHAVQPSLGVRGLYRSAMRIGRDHIASSIYTIVLAYAGAALSVLVLFAIADRGFTSVVTSDEVAEEVVRALIGSVGLAFAAPITTALAAFVVTRSTRS